MMELEVQEFQDLWRGVRSSSILLKLLCMKRTLSSSQLREEEGVEDHVVILPSDVILKHERPNQALCGTRLPHQDFLGMQSGFVNLMWILRDPETEVLSVNVPREVKVGFTTKPNVFLIVRVLLQVITEFLREPCPLFSARGCQRLEDMDPVRMHA
jgi:hypothetical protein